MATSVPCPFILLPISSSVFSTKRISFPSGVSHLSFKASTEFLKPLLSDCVVLDSWQQRSKRLLIRACENVEHIENGDVNLAMAIPQNKKTKVARRPQLKQQVVLKFVWMEKNIGLALDQFLSGHGTVPISPYYFWPRKDAWEELKIKLESKKWISRKQTILLLNQATDIINLWQQNATEM